MRYSLTGLAVLLTAIIFAAPALAQNDPSGKYQYQRNSEDWVVNIIKQGTGYLVSGQYVIDGQGCQISGSYYTATHKVKAQCTAGRSTVMANGIVEFAQGQYSTSALLTLTVRNRTTQAYRIDTGITGLWKVTQFTANGTRYTGTFRITQNGSQLSGRAEWDNHNNGDISGSVSNGSVRITITYPGGLIGTYRAELSSGGTTMVSGTASSNRGGGSVNWTATKQL